MEIDIKTLTIILGITHLMQMLVFYHQYRVNNQLNGPGWWFLWSSAETIGFLFVFLRSIPAIEPIAIFFQNIFIIGGTLFIYIGVLRFYGQKINLGFVIPYFTSFVALHLYYFLVINDIQIRTLVFDIYLSFIAFFSAYTLYKHKTRLISASVIFNAVVFTVHGSIFLYRSIILMVGPVEIEMFSSSIFNLIQFFDALVVSLLWTFGFIIMLNQRLNNEISETKAHFEQIFDTSPEAVVISRLSDGKFIDCNDNYSRITGFAKEEVIGKTSTEINIWVNAADRNIIIDLIKEYGICENREFRFRRKNGEVFPGLMSAQIMFLKGIPHIISVTSDISELKKTQQEIRVKNEELLNLNSLKDRLFSIIAHDLRNPLNTIIGYSDMLQDDIKKFSENEALEMIKTINKTATNTSTLLENLLHWAVTQSGQLDLVFQPVKIEELIKNAISFYQIHSKEKNIQIKYSCEVAEKVNTDANMVSIILYNLIANAIKFSHPGGIIRIEANKIHGKICISISDHGTGVGEEVKDQIFKGKIHPSTRGTLEEKGTGLGLSLCNELTELLGGTIWFESEKDKGSSFYFTIPE